MRTVRLFAAALGVVAMCAGAVRAGEGLRQALTLMNEGRPAEAVVVLREVVASSPADPAGHLALGVAFLQSGDDAAAGASLERAVALHPDSLPAHYSLAMVREKTGNYAAAKAGWERVRDLAHDAELRTLAEKHISQLRGRIQ